MDVKELESKTVAELKEIAKEQGISGISSMKKADLVAAIAGASDAPAPEPEPAPPETPKTVSVKLVAPAGAKVFLDGKLVGRTPSLTELEATPGVHVVKVVHPRLGKRAKKVQFGKVKKVRIDLKSR